MTLAIERPDVRDTDVRDTDVRNTATRTDTPNDVAELVTAHLPLVGHLVREFGVRVPAHVDREDLRSAALYALVTSARAFDPSRGASFSSFAAIRIRGALRDELRALDWASRSVRKKARGLEAARDELTESLGRSPAATEIAAALGITVGALASVEADVHRASVQSLDAIGCFDGTGAAMEDAHAPEAMLLRREELDDLRTAVADLPDRLRFVIEQYFFGQRRMADIAAELGVTESRVSQLRSEALRGLRQRMNGMVGAA